jgi:hypothetical protein
MLTGMNVSANTAHENPFTANPLYILLFSTSEANGCFWNVGACGVYSRVEVGANSENGNSHVSLQSILWFFEFVPGDERKAFLGHFSVKHITFARELIEQISVNRISRCLPV